MLAEGRFEVTLQPLEGYASGENDIMLGRMSIEKQFFGDLEAQSRGEMLSARTPVKTSAGYVAIEQVQGKLQDRHGSFVLQHFGMMSGGENRLILEVVPDSGTGELQGLSGSMEIIIENGEHRYRFTYEI
ncbi:DUF3224 domain-containing protein [bacterium]|nr:DUF3224 domain-containing protein [bacterium]